LSARTANLLSRRNDVEMAEKKESCLEELKVDYEKLRKKYNLPSFKQMNEDFEIEKISQHETECLLREVRKIIMEKVIIYLRFVEMLLNPSNAPMFFFALVKGMTASDKRLLESLYEKIGRFEIGVIPLDCKYNEKQEAEFIKQITSEWPSISEDMIELSGILKKNWNQTSKKDEKGYFG
jgi:hypothetical protein